jgi:hypothetical protein
MKGPEVTGTHTSTSQCFVSAVLSAGCAALATYTTALIPSPCRKLLQTLYLVTLDHPTPAAAKNICYSPWPPKREYGTCQSRTH